jgi:hypothetical protein
MPLLDKTQSLFEVSQRKECVSVPQDTKEPEPPIEEKALTLLGTSIDIIVSKVVGLSSVGPDWKREVTKGDRPC